MGNKNKLYSSFVQIVALMFILSACTSQQPATPTAIASTHTPTAQPSSTLTLTLQPATSTPTQALPTHTPIPAFELAPPAATITPPPKASCPALDPSLKFDEDIFDILYEAYPEVGKETRYTHVPSEDLQSAFEKVGLEIANFLSVGGHHSKLEQLFQTQDTLAEPRFFGEIYLSEITGDNVPEIFVHITLPLAEETLFPPVIDAVMRVFSRISHQDRFFMYACRNGKYINAWSYNPLEPGPLVEPRFIDLNNDGLNEVVLIKFPIAMVGAFLDLKILGWDNGTLVEGIEGKLLSDYDSPFIDSGGTRDGWASARAATFEFKDIDENGTTEVIIHSYWGGSVCEPIDRDTKLILQWDGTGYPGYYRRTPPVYRIQAVWDGDDMTQWGFFSEALAFYDLAIYDESLLGWSEDYNELTNTFCEDLPDWHPMPQNPKFDQDEAVRLGAYAHYRKMLVYVVLGDIKNAQDTYEKLGTEYQSTAGEIYIDLASVFWDEYSLSGDIKKACNGARSFVARNRDEVVTMSIRTSIYDSWSGKFYLDEDICPFGSGK